MGGYCMGMNSYDDEMSSYEVLALYTVFYMLVGTNLRTTVIAVQFDEDYVL
jgi:hypothetical protein